MQRYSMLLLAAVALLAPAAEAAEPPAEATAALSSVRRLVARKEADPKLEQKKVEGLQRLGFASKSELLRATLAEPVSVYMVRLDSLQRYRAGDDVPSELLTALDSQIYPLQVDSRAKAAVFVDQGKLSGFGSPRLTLQLEELRTQLAKQTGLPESAFFLVNIPALNVSLLGYHSKSASIAAPPAVVGLTRLPSLASPTLSQSLARTAKTTLAVSTPLSSLPQVLMLTPLDDYQLPLGQREGFLSLTRGKTVAADVLFRQLQQPASAIDVSVPR